MNSGVFVARDYNHIERDRRLKIKNSECNRRNNNGVLIVIVACVLVCFIKFIGA